MSTRANGDLSQSEEFMQKETPFIQQRGIQPNEFILMNQVHEANIRLVSKKQIGKRIPGTDAVVTQTKNLFLGVKTADCVPLFFYDPEKHAIGVTHAGWKGTHAKIAIRTVRKLQDIGSDPKQIRVAIGPHIGGCCYVVQTDRAELFKQIFADERVTYFTEGNWHLDLGLANKKQLQESGVIESQIDAPIACSSCQVDQFYSNRKEGVKAGRMLGIIGIKSYLL